MATLASLDLLLRFGPPIAIKPDVDQYTGARPIPHFRTSFDMKREGIRYAPLDAGGDLGAGDEASR